MYRLCAVRHLEIVREHGPPVGGGVTIGSGSSHSRVIAPPEAPKRALRASELGPGFGERLLGTFGARRWPLMRLSRMRTRRTDSSHRRSRRAFGFAVERLASNIPAYLPKAPGLRRRRAKSRSLSEKASRPSPRRAACRMSGGRGVGSAATCLRTSGAHRALRAMMCGDRLGDATTSRWSSRAGPMATRQPLGLSVQIVSTRR
jgi:hypothetical protein